MWQTKYASAVPKYLGEGVNFWLFPLWESVVRELHHQFDKLDDKKIGISKKISSTHDQENLNYTALKSSINQE